MAGNRPKWQLHLPAMLVAICAPVLILVLVGQSSAGANQFTSFGQLGRLLLRDGVWWAGIPFLLTSGITLLLAAVAARLRQRQATDWARTALVALWVGSLSASIGLFGVVGMFQTG